MKIKIKEIIQEKNIVKIIFDDISLLEKEDILDFYKEGNIYFKLRSELGIIYGMQFFDNVLRITTLDKYQKEVEQEFIKYIT